MQKKIIALAIAATLAVPAMASAATTMYGQVNMAYEITDTGAAAGTNVGTNAPKKMQVSSNVSRLGLKGTDDLGHGLTALWQMEGEVFTDTGAAKLFTRNTFIGVQSGSFGTVVLGNHDTPYKIASRDLDVFKDRIADNRAIMGGGHDARLTDVVAYLSPNWGGFSAAVALAGGTDNTINAAPAATTETSATSLYAKFAMDSWSVTLANQAISAKDSVTPANKFDANATKVAGTFGMKAFSVNAVLEMLSGKNAAGIKTDRNNIYVSGQFNIGDGAVKAAVTMSSDAKVGGVTATGSGATQISAGYDYALSKNTTVFALYTAVSNKAAANYGLSTAGSTGGFATTTAGSDPSAIALGVRHSF